MTQIFQVMRVSVLAGMVLSAFLFGCKTAEVSEPIIQHQPKTIIRIGFRTAALEGNLATTIEPHPQEPYICIWNIQDSSKIQYSQNEDTVIHHFGKPGMYLIGVVVVNAYTSDTIGIADTLIEVTQSLHDQITSALQSMTRISILFIADKKYLFTEHYTSIEKDRMQDGLNLSIAMAGRVGVYDNKYSNGDFNGHSLSSKLHNWFQMRSDDILDSLYFGWTEDDGGPDASGQRWENWHSYKTLKVVRLPMILFTPDSIVYELSGVTVKDHCEMQESYQKKASSGSNTNEGYTLTSINWQNSTIIPMLRVVLKK